MNQIGEHENAFAIPDFGKTMRLAQFEIEPIIHKTELWQPLQYGSDSEQGLQTDGSCNLERFDYLNLDLPDLSSFNYGILETSETLESSSTLSVGDSDIGRDPVKDDSPPFQHVLSYKEPYLKLNSWERFYNKRFEEPRSVYLSEGGNAAFDAALNLGFNGAHSLQMKKGNVVDSLPIIKSLALLGIGRESVLFQYDQSRKTFQSSVEGMRMSGYSVDSFSSLTTTFVNYGNKITELEKFVDIVYSSDKSFPTLISLAHIISIILIVMKSQFGNNLIMDTSLLQLQDLFQGPGLITSWLWKVSTELITTQCDGELLSKLFNSVQDLENADARLRPVAFEILRHVSRPWLESVGSWLGINKEQSEKSKFSIAHEDIRSNLDGNELQHSRYGLRQNMVPKFINEGDAEIIFETGRSLRMLKNYKPQHPLANLEALGMIDPHPLEWQFSWQDAEETTIRAKEYEQTTIGEIRHFNESKRSYNLSILKFEDILVEETRIPDTSTEVAEVQIKLSNAEIESPLVPDIPAHFNILTKALVRCSTLNIEAGEEDSSRFAPPLSLLPLLSFNPLIYAQARLINHATLRLLFKEHQIRMHLSIQHRYSLFGDALFATRLSHALYDPEMHSAEHRKGYSRSGESGLRLGSRDTWPPASSELRLVLTGILTESFNDSAGNMTASSAELPGGLSFAVREMCEDDFSRCKNPDSIEALDFLRLQYRPPATLDAIITPSCLSKYDLLFKTLLRGTRMLFVVNQFSCHVDNRCFARTHIQLMFTRFKSEARHFVSTICNYFFDGIRVNWDMFSRRLDEIENHLDNYESRECHGLQRLRNFHEKVLDRIMFALLLRQRQEQVMKLLEEIFSIILVFARLTRSGVDNKQGNALDEKIEDIYPRFAKKVRIFVSVCRGLGERRGLGGLNLQHEHDGFEGDQSEEGGNTFGQLLLNLDMNGFYSRSEKR